MKNTILSALILVIGLSFTAPTFAWDEEDKEILALLHEDMKEFHEEKVKPQMLEWKDVIDENLSAEELEILNELRAKNEELMKSHREMMLRVREAKKNGEEIDRERIKAANERFRDAKHKIMEQLKRLIEANEEFFSRLREDVSTTHEEWKEIREGIFDEWCQTYPDVCEELKEGKGKRRRGMAEFDGEKPIDDTQNGYNNKGRRERDGNGDGKNMDCEFGNKRGHFMKRHMFANVVLFNGTFPERPLDNEISETIAGVNELDQNEVKLQNAPNPFTGITTISFNLTDDTNVRLTVTDYTGASVKTITDKFYPAGSHQIEFNASDNNLSKGSYIYRLETDYGFKTGKMIIK